ncbi:hypothetical protein SAMN05421823_108267 [Catalinimonas alkaloidigena]|uniref:YXWGXW repeat-containing protein n=1 Tax=Catalinimonas alkaloidigena TaxID=1075417 RepID=A0A1G9NEK0_9BACT|nr:hypothetical protein [Catalinimonas alkaloidigena]SDL84814.1 hypothetical protein SAMN05421823_108267 [Catalinimonas alkaloidigena]
MKLFNLRGLAVLMIPLLAACTAQRTASTGSESDALYFTSADRLSVQQKATPRRSEATNEVAPSTGDGYYDSEYSQNYTPSETAPAQVADAEAPVDYYDENYRSSTTSGGYASPSWQTYTSPTWVNNGWNFYNGYYDPFFYSPYVMRNSFSPWMRPGLTVSFGYGVGWGSSMWANPYYAYGYDPFWGPGYGYGAGYYSPFAYGYSSFYNPWGYGYYNPWYGNAYAYGGGYYGGSLIDNVREKNNVVYGARASRGNAVAVSSVGGRSTRSITRGSSTGGERTVATPSNGRGTAQPATVRTVGRDVIERADVRPARGERITRSSTSAPLQVGDRVTRSSSNASYNRSAAPVNMQRDAAQRSATQQRYYSTPNYSTPSRSASPSRSIQSTRPTRSNSYAQPNSVQRSTYSAPSRSYSTPSRSYDSYSSPSRSSDSYSRPSYSAPSRSSSPSFSAPSRSVSPAPSRGSRGN